MKENNDNALTGEAFKIPLVSTEILGQNPKKVAMDHLSILALGLGSDVQCGGGKAG